MRGNETRRPCAAASAVARGQRPRWRVTQAAASHSPGHLNSVINPPCGNAVPHVDGRPQRGMTTPFCKRFVMLRGFCGEGFTRTTRILEGFGQNMGVTLQGLDSPLRQRARKPQSTQILRRPAHVGMRRLGLG